ncbi:PAS domain S-box protein [Brasilonema sp. CT11]|nr:PAS domain S-box protein [Brasilonema sp. CT11]
MKDEEKTKEQLIEELTALRQNLSQLEQVAAQQQEVQEALRQQRESSRRQVQKEQALNRVIQSIRNSLDLKTIFSTAAYEITQLVSADRVEIVQYIPERQLWLNVADYHQTPDLPSALGLEIPDADNEIAARLKRLEVVQIEDASACSDEINRSLAQTYRGAWLLVPVHFGSTVWGSLSLIRNNHSLSWQQEEVELTCAVADQLAIAIHQSTLLLQVQTELAERKQVKAALQEKQYFIQRIVETSPDIIYVYDLVEQRNIYINRQMLEILGYAFQEIQAMRETVLPNLVHPDDIVRVTEHLKGFETVKDGEVLEIEYRMKDVNCEWRWLRSRETVFAKNAEGLCVQILGVASDITERKQAEHKIREQAAWLDVATDAIIVRDLENKIVFWNKSAERLYGWKAKDVLSKNANDILYKRASLQLQQALSQVNLTGEWYGELSQIRKDGKEVLVETRWTLVRDEHGNPKSILIVNTDITEKKKLQTQFLRAQRLESLGTLASGIAHDLNNTIAPMLMSAQLLRMRISDERNQQILQTLETNAQRGAAMVKQVLSFARGVEGKRTILQIRHLISEIEQFAKQTFPKSIEFCTEIVPNLWTISGDATQLHQVLMNLVINARDAMPKGGVLSIYAENFFIDENYARTNLDATVGFHIVITIKDTGIGMPPEVLDRIFEPFFTTKEVGKGSGLGLSTVLGIMKSHNGFISVSSKVGKGTQFQVFLKAVLENQTLPQESLELPMGNGELILVVDDEAEIREITKITLENYNYKVLTACDGIEALALYAQNPEHIKVVFVDMMMPDMDGLTTIRALLKMNPCIKIMAASGITDNQKLTQSLGVETFLSKPYNIKNLLQVLQKILN